MPVRLTHATSLILRALATGHRHGFQVMEATGLASGTVYPALRRLERSGHLTSTWEDESTARADGRPRRRRYRLTASGTALADRAGGRLIEAQRLLAADAALRTAGGPESAG